MKRTTEFKRLSASEAATRLLDIKKPRVLVHIRPDGDAIGSAAALCLVFDKLGVLAKIVSADKIPERLKFILEYTGVFLAGECEGDTSDVAIDVASPAQLGKLYDEQHLPTLMIDHHIVGEAFADGYISPTASSAAEALFDIIEELIGMGKIELDEKLAFALYTAISSDTGRFSYSSTTPKTHRIAARLMECGIDASDINRRLFDSKTHDQIRAEGFIASRIKTEECGAVTYATLTASELASLGILAENFETAIDVIRSVRGAEISFFVREVGEKQYKASLRSVKVDVSQIAKIFGGGGHIKASGCTVMAESMDNAVEMIMKEIKAVI